MQSKRVSYCLFEHQRCQAISVIIYLHVFFFKLTKKKLCFGQSVLLYKQFTGIADLCNEIISQEGKDIQLYLSVQLSVFDVVSLGRLSTLIC